MKKRVYNLTAEEEIEMRILMESGELNPIAEEHHCSYLEAYHIYTGKLSPSFEPEQNNMGDYV